MPDPLPPLDAEQITRLRVLLEATTQGEWGWFRAGSIIEVRGPDPKIPIVGWPGFDDCLRTDNEHSDNCHFIAEAHNWFSRLLDAAEHTAAMQSQLSEAFGHIDAAASRTGDHSTGIQGERKT